MTDQTIQDLIEQLRSALADQVTAGPRLLADVQAALARQTAGAQAALALAVQVQELAGQTPDPPHPPDSTGMVRGLWRFGWKNISPDSWPSDIRPMLNLLILSMAQSAASGTGRLTDPPSTSRSLVTALTSAGVDVFVGIGGSGDGGIRITNDTQVSEALTSAKRWQSTYGVTGIVFDLESDPGQSWTVDAVTKLGKACVAAGLKVGIWSALYSGRLQAWGSVAKSLGEGLHHWQRGFYDFPEAGDSRLTNIVTGDLAAMRQYVARENQLVASFMPRPTSPYPNSSPIPVISAAFSAARAKYPSVGWSVWEDSIEAATGWGATRALSSRK